MDDDTLVSVELPPEDVMRIKEEEEHELGVGDLTSDEDELAVETRRKNFIRPNPETGLPEIKMRLPRVDEERSEKTQYDTQCRQRKARLTKTKTHMCPDCGKPTGTYGKHEVAKGAIRHWASYERGKDEK